MIRIQSRDIIAGVTLAALAIPEVMGYTRIIGTPVYTGFYTLIFPVLIFAYFGSSRHLVIGADSATAAIVASSLAGTYALHSENYFAATILIALICGALLILARIFNLGFVSDFLSRTVLVGFLSGVGVQVAGSQIAGMLGLPHGTNPFESFAFIHVLTAWIAVGILGLLLLSARVLPRFPGALVVMILALVCSHVFDWHASGVAVLGEIHSGLPKIAFPEMDRHKIFELIPVSLSCVLVILAQSAATARAYALKYEETLNENRDLLGLGLGNIAAALSGTFVVNGSPTKTEIADSAGARTQTAQVVMAFCVIGVVLFLTRPLEALPEAALCAVVFSIGLKLIDIRGLKDIFRHNRVEFWLAILTACTVVGFGVARGIFTAVVLSLLNHVRHSYRPRSALLKRGADGEWQMTSLRAPDVQAAPGVAVFWFGADLFFANSENFSNEVRALAQREGVKRIVIHAGAITAIDYSAGRELRTLIADLSQHGIEIVWAAWNLPWKPPEKCYATVAEAIASARTSSE